MTASASVVEALRRITEIYVGAPVNTEEANAYAGALHEAQDLANEALSALTPQPAEQDAREAAARVEALAKAMGDPEVDRFTMPGKTANKHAADLRAILALTQAAPDGCGDAREVERITRAFDDSVSLSWHRYSLARDLSNALTWALAEIDGEAKYENETQRQNCREKAEDAIRAMLSASPAPPAQGAG